MRLTFQVPVWYLYILEPYLDITVCTTVLAQNCTRPSANTTLIEKHKHNDIQVSRALDDSASVVSDGDII